MDEWEGANEVLLCEPLVVRADSVTEEEGLWWVNFYRVLSFYKFCFCFILAPKQWILFLGIGGEELEVFPGSVKDVFIYWLNACKEAI